MRTDSSHRILLSKTYSVISDAYQLSLGHCWEYEGIEWKVWILFAPEISNLFVPVDRSQIPWAFSKPLFRDRKSIASEDGWPIPEIDVSGWRQASSVPIAANTASNRRDSTSFLHRINSLVRRYRLRRKCQGSLADSPQRDMHLGGRGHQPRKHQTASLIDRAIRPQVVASESRKAMAFFSAWWRRNSGITYDQRRIGNCL
jgi:hypothetical protein